MEKRKIIRLIALGIAGALNAALRHTDCCSSLNPVVIEALIDGIMAIIFIDAANDALPPIKGESPREPSSKDEDDAV